MRKKILILVLCLACCLTLLGGCKKKKDVPHYSSGALIRDEAGSHPLLGAEQNGDTILHEEEFGGVYIDCTIEDFNALGFTYGDSVTIVFSNGYELKDIPYYNGYYTANGVPLLVAYPGYPYIKAAINNGDDLWEVAGLSETDTADITLAEAGKYADIQDARDIHYYDERERYETDAEFANFRNIQVGQIREGVLYRSASPCDNQHNRAPYVDALAAEAGIQSIINLADTEEKIARYIADPEFACEHFYNLYEGGHVVLVKLNMNYSSNDFKAKVANGMIFMAENPGPYLVHCTEGKDRTGFVCMLLEALCGASYKEIVDDYMITYDNYYKITAESEAKRYNVIVSEVLDPMVRTIVSDEDLTKADLAAGAEQYLLEGGMTEAQIAALKENLMK